MRHIQPPVWGVWKIEESEDELLKQLTRYDYINPMTSVRPEKRRREWLAVRVLLKELLGEETAIAYHSGGAPYLPEKKLYFSASHTTGYAAVILSEQGPAGIDIEYIDDRVNRVRSRFMRPEEEAMICPEHETEHLLVCWCAKEALFKLIGSRGVYLREHLCISPFKPGKSGYLTAVETFTPQKNTYSMYYIVNKYFAMTCSLDMMVVRRPSLLNSAIMVLLFLMR
ncbi:MAG: 4'-phosphopantetheinyl transferase superfamily protein [Tannerellaceae bacterium]|jgi:phosphopantetheinyl transferase|nr:4'-phosphopantetheinyl transferase superfamily protein [Tannerellaceae bacterium]